MNVRDARLVCVALFVAAAVTGLLPFWDDPADESVLLGQTRVAAAEEPQGPDGSIDETAETGEGTDSEVLRVGTAGDSSMMFMNAAIADAIPQNWVSVPEALAIWTSGTGGLDRNGCGAFGDDLDFFYNPELGPLPMRNNHAPEPELTCDWTKWLPDAFAEMDLDVLVVSFGPSSMWGYDVGAGPVDLGDPTLVERLRSAHQAIALEATAAGVKELIWVAYPPVINTDIQQRSPHPQYATNPDQADRYFALLSSLDGGVVDVRDILDEQYYVDGTHFGELGAAIAAERIADAVDEIQRASGESE